LVLLLVLLVVVLLVPLRELLGSVGWQKQRR
jgi:hypothetical protein